MFALLLLAGYWKEERSDSKSLTISLMGALSTLATVGVLDGWEESDSHPAPFERASILMLCTFGGTQPSGGDTLMICIMSQISESILNVYGC